jgi:hypothetical protein
MLMRRVASGIVHSCDFPPSMVLRAPKDSCDSKSDDQEANRTQRTHELGQPRGRRGDAERGHPKHAGCDHEA